MSAIYSDKIEGAAFITRAVMREVEEAVERARVVGVLDAWAKRVAGRAHTMRNGDMSEVCDLEFVNGRTKHNKGFFGPTPDAARAAAAKAIEAGEV